jgi:hypothetical protein
LTDEIVVEPAITAVISPFEPAAFETVATPVFEELQVANAVRSCVVLSENVPVAVNCCVDPAVREEASGVTTIESSVAGVIVKRVDPVMLPDVAVIVVEPVARGVTKPFEPAALLMAATDAVDEPQVTAVVRFCVEPSEYVPLAVNCWVVPSAMLGKAGVIATETSVAGVTVRVVLPEIFPNVAVIDVAPVPTDVANPFEPAALLMAATDDADEPQVTAVVRFSVEPSEYVPVAVNCRVVPSAMLGPAGVIATETSVARVTVRVVLLEMLPHVAVIVVVPAARGVANPFEPAVLLTVAVEGEEELQVDVAVIFWVELSEKVPVAVNC